MKQSCQDVVTNELDAAAVPYRVENTKNHIHVRYGENYEHLHVVAKTPSDWRASLNERACIRRDLKRFGYVTDDEQGAPQDVALVDLKDGEARCYSYHIAEHFGKAHRDVTRAIDKVRSECGPEFDLRNFAQIEYVDEKGRTYRAYSMTRDGFSLVVMGFTGAAAMRWKIKYIEAFNAMAGELTALSSAHEVSRLTGEVDAMAGLLADMETRLDKLPAQRKAPFVRPSIIRRQKREARAVRRSA